jgi:hypothetical protein
LVGSDLHLIAFAVETFDLVASQEKVQFAFAFLTSLK